MHAVILAAGLGTRLQSVLQGRAKALLEVGGRSLLHRSVGRLEEHGLDSLTVVVGYEGSALRAALLEMSATARVVENPDPEHNGSMRSLALARDALRDAAFDEILVLEGDILYGPEALLALYESPMSDAVVLGSSPTGSGDEVWVCGVGGRITEIAKEPRSGAPHLGELVGLTRLTRETLDAMADGHLEAGKEAEREHYEERLSLLTDTLDVRAHIVEGLVWTEIDDPAHLSRAVRQVLPKLEALSQRCSDCGGS